MIIKLDGCVKDIIENLNNKLKKKKNTLINE